MKQQLIYFLVFSTLLLMGCVKNVALDLPEREPQVVVDGYIETGQPPIVLLTRTLNYFEPTSLEYFQEAIIGDAEVKIVVDNDTLVLAPICTENLPDSLKPLVGDLLGLPISDAFNICIYTDISLQVIGTVGKTYKLLIQTADGNQLDATTALVEPVTLDSLEFRVNGTRDSLGFVYAHITEPATQGNAYRWWAQRTNTYKYGELKGQVKDFNYISPFGSVFNDELVNGQDFEFGYNRGSRPGSTKEDDENGERGFFKVGDTIDVKFASIDFEVYQYYRTYYLNLSNSGSPFATPTNILSNVNGGLGVWAGYSTTFYQVIAERE